MKRIKIISFTISMILIIGLSFTFAGCDEFLIEEAIGFGYDVAYAESGSDGGDALYGCDQFSGVLIEENIASLFNSRQELLDFSDEKGLPFFEIKGDDRYHLQKNIYDSELSQRIRSYDETFFNENSLLLIFIVFPNVDPAKVDTVYIQGNELIVEIARPETDSFMDAESHHAFVIECSKNNMENKSAKLSIIRKGATKDYLDENGKYNW